MSSIALIPARGGSLNVLPLRAIEHVFNRAARDTKAISHGLNSLFSLSYVSNRIFSQLRLGLLLASWEMEETMGMSVTHILKAADPFKIFRDVVPWVSVFVVALLAFFRETVKGHGYKTPNISAIPLVVKQQHHSWASSLWSAAGLLGRSGGGSHNFAWFAHASAALSVSKVPSGTPDTTMARGFVPAFVTGVRDRFPYFFHRVSIPEGSLCQP